ncbi:EAL and GGDEF domain-containing protein [Pusillimonas sp. MFBS29]|uniref:GGDEF domain-containing protein n=1 Tax=Pusillimonas sp. MFBS29 TaxID=2886690 RepID=UPI001D11BABD|nr:bifunctional diguanylate cyclase/phosphodiesterase [Pusillimonas sp. MFBS29]MCC2595739.1 EAL and GGDEF domain-containing protein [Pusillimonas sp. MFBS29]
MSEAPIHGAASQASNTEVPLLQVPVTAALKAELHSVLQEGMLDSAFQPIADLRTGTILGYEALVRGPVNSHLHDPRLLFHVARACGQLASLEKRCLKLHMDRFNSLGIQGKLFLNMGVEVLAMSGQEAGMLLSHTGALSPANVVLEIVGAQAIPGCGQLRQAITEYRSVGVRIAMDGLGEGYSSLRLWIELCPEYIKIDKYLVRDINQDPLKQQFVRSICDIARKSGAHVIAEGIETLQEFHWIRSQGIRYGQGYFLAAPDYPPITRLRTEILEVLPTPALHQQFSTSEHLTPTVSSILRQVPVVEHNRPIADAYAIFSEQSELQLVAVLRDGVPIGLLYRARLLERMARPSYRAQRGEQPCADFIETQPIIVDHQTTLQDIGHLISEVTSGHQFDGFIITRQGNYQGVGTGFDLIREITALQIKAAKHANPLTQLPGGVPINEHIDVMLNSKVAFCVCYVDLDHFKPFNDSYSYRKGDAVIQTAASLLAEHIDPDVDFLGHIGGDDFIIVFRSTDWRERCQQILDRFARETVIFYQPAHLEAGGYVAENRQGEPVFHPLISLSIGAVKVAAGMPLTSYQIAEFASRAKSQAKKIPGNSIFVERRSLLPGSALKTRKRQ